MNLSAVQAIFFDLGMVLVSFDWDIAIPRFAAENGGDVERVRAFLAHPYHEAFERGDMSPQEFFERGCQLMGFRGTFDQFRRSWSEIFTEIESSVQLARQLGAAYPLYVLSNTNPWHVARVEQQFDWLQLFRARYYSCDLGVRKPDPRIYRMALACAQVRPDHTLFIDDRLENLEGAAAVGMQTLHAPTPDVLRARLALEFPDLFAKALDREAL
jgi:putative hydrolase of the HAD superfamily